MLKKENILFSFLFLCLRRLLNDIKKTGLCSRSKNRRAQICQVNIKVNFLSWIVEFLGCMTIALNFLVIGNRSNAMTGLIVILTMSVYMVILPCTFLINSSAGINTIVDQSWFDAISRIFKPVQESDPNAPSRRNKEEKKDAKETQSPKLPPIYTISKTVASTPKNTNTMSKMNQTVDQETSRPHVKIAWQ